jgi:nucleoside-diphosphate-sugar epimerase
LPRALALERSVSVGRAYNTTGDRESVWDLATAWREAGGRAAWAMLPLPLPFTMHFDSSRARAELGWQPRPLVEGLRETFRLEATGG